MTALGVRRHLKKKPIKAKTNGFRSRVHGHAYTRVHGHAYLTHLVLVVSTLVNSTVSIASRLALAAKLLILKAM